MSEIMRPMSFEQLLNWTLTEYKENGTVFGERHPYHADSKFNRTIFGRDLETPIGPAAGPNTQLTQNIIAAYYTGSRFFELKTVQVMDGDELAACINRPCIKADDECYNCEWSTELFVPQAMEEYIKAWFLLKVISKEFGLGSMDGFQFNISVGYDLAGIKSEKVDTFLNTMQHAQDSEIFKHCKAYLLEHVDLFEKVTAEDIESISGDICNSVTISTLHGCPPEEIEKIAMYLITEKGFHTFIKCNPTLLGYEYARKTMDDMGYDYIAFGDFHFKDDLQYEDAVPMLNRLIAVCQERNLEFGVKITNTFPVVFIGPCAAKKLEASRRTVRSDVDFVVTFEELQAMFDAKGIDLTAYEAESSFHDATGAGRGYACAGGVAKAIEECINEYYPGTQVNIEHAEGLAECKKILTLAKAGRMNGCLIEGMGCPGGCIAGAGTNIPIPTAKKDVAAYVKNSSRALPPKELEEIELK